MTARLDKVLTIGFCLLWALIILVDYWYYHASYAVALQYFQYVDTLLILSVFGGTIFWLINQKREHKIVKYLTNGMGIYLLFMLISAVILWSHYLKVSQDILDIVEGLTYLGKVSYILLACYFILTASYALGDLFLKELFDVTFKSSVERMVKLGIGITLFSLLFTIFAFFDLLKIHTTLPFFLIVLGIRWKSVIAFIKATLLQPLASKTALNGIGFASIFLMLIFISLNFLSNVRPFPFGFDALAIYLNLPNLISQQGGMIQGYSPYYWSIFIATGQIIFGQMEITIALSVGGGVLSLFAIYEISRKWIDENFSLLIVLIFYSLPLINYQSFRDVKTDLGLLFILLLAFLVLMKWLSLYKGKTLKEGEVIQKAKTKEKNTIEASQNLEIAEPLKKKGLLATVFTKPEQLVILLGILSGMALGIKLTSLIFIFAVLSVFSFVKGRTIAFLVNFGLTIFIILIGKLDTSLRAYHFGVANLQWGILLISMLGLGYFIYTQRQNFTNLLKITTIYLMTLSLFYAPWPIKNYQETGKISIQTLIEGKPVGIPHKRILDKRTIGR